MPQGISLTQLVLYKKFNSLGCAEEFSVYLLWEINTCVGVV